MLHLLFMISVFVSLNFIRMHHPISMGLTLVGQVVVAGLITGLLSGSFWYAYILFLVILGGVLVLFIYMTSLVSNEVFTTTWVDLLMLSVGLSVLVVATGLVVTPAGAGLGRWAGDLHSFDVPNLFGLAKLYSHYSFSLTLFLVIYLLMVLLVCVKLVGIKFGALRKFN